MVHDVIQAGAREPSPGRTQTPHPSLLAELEAFAARRGYTRIYLTTGPPQPEPKTLYLRTGYQPQFDLAADPETVGIVAFTKDLPPLS